MYANIVSVIWSQPTAKRKRSNPGSAVCLPGNTWTAILLHILLLHLSAGLDTQESTLQDIQTLATMLPGCYSNVNQYYKHVKRGLPPEKRHFMLKAEIYKMAKPMFNDSVTFYFQDFTKSSTSPFRSGFYSFSVEANMTVMRMRTFQLQNNAHIPRAFQQSQGFTLENHLAAAMMSDLMKVSGNLRTYSACDMFWKRMGDNIFVGITGPLCLGALGKDQVRIGVAMTLTKDRLLLTDSWFKVSDGTQITEVKVPYILQKLALPSSSGVSRRPPLAQSSQDRMSNDADTSAAIRQSLKPTVSKSRNSLKPHFSDLNNALKTRKHKRSHLYPKASRHRILRNFQQVAAALTSGHNVYYRVELSACAIPEQVKVDRLSFGGVIRTFVYVKQDGGQDDRKDYIYFMSHKTVMGNQGPEYISRQLTLSREGRVKVEITKRFSDTTKVKQGYAFVCKLYNDLKGYGGVKLGLDPANQVRPVNSFSSLTAQVDQGRDLHVIADLARCRGSHRQPALVIGSQITNYDFVNNGKTVEIFIPFVQIMSTSSDDNRTPTQGFMGQILKNGDVILTLISNSQSQHGLDSVFNLSTAYHCTLSNRNEVLANDENEHSVKLFYLK